MNVRPNKMVDFLNSALGQIIARNGILAVILAWSMYSNHGLVERLFTVIESNTKAMTELRALISDKSGDRSAYNMER